MLASDPSSSAVRASPFPAVRRPVTWIFYRMASSRFPPPNVFPAFGPSAKLVPPTTPSADFCAAVGSPLGFPSSELARNTTQTSPGKLDRLPRTPAGSTAMAIDGFWTSRLVARSSDQGCLVSDFCSSGRGFAPHCLQTPPRDDALVLRSSFTSIRLDRGLSPPSHRTCWAHH